MKTVSIHLGPPRLHLSWQLSKLPRGSFSWSYKKKTKKPTCPPWAFHCFISKLTHTPCALRQLFQMGRKSKRPHRVVMWGFDQKYTKQRLSPRSLDRVLAPAFSTQTRRKLQPNSHALVRISLSCAYCFPIKALQHWPDLGEILFFFHKLMSFILKNN